MNSSCPDRCRAACLLVTRLLDVAQSQEEDECAHGQVDIEDAAPPLSTSRSFPVPGPSSPMLAMAVQIPMARLSFARKGRADQGERGYADGRRNLGPRAPRAVVSTAIEGANPQAIDPSEQRNTYQVPAVPTEAGKRRRHDEDRHSGCRDATTHCRPSSPPRNCAGCRAAPRSRSVRRERS